jgi:hypothetical protein
MRQNRYTTRAVLVKQHSWNTIPASLEPVGALRFLIIWMPCAWMTSSPAKAAPQVQTRPLSASSTATYWASMSSAFTSSRAHHPNRLTTSEPDRTRGHGAGAGRSPGATHHQTSSTPIHHHTERPCASWPLPCTACSTTTAIYVTSSAAPHNGLLSETTRWSNTCNATYYIMSVLDTAPH